MRLKACIREPRAFAAIFTAIKTSHKKCIIRFGGQKVRVIARGPHDALADSGAQIWTTTSSEALFSDFKCESANDNQVFVEVLDVASILFALRVCDKAGVSATAPTLMRLVQDGAGQLLVISRTSIGGGAKAGGGLHDFVHEVPVKVLDALEIDAVMRPPPLAAPDVAHFDLPPLHEVQALVDRLRACRVHQLDVAFRCAADSTNGMLTLSGQTPGLAMAVNFADVQLKNADQLREHHRRKQLLLQHQQHHGGAAGGGVEAELAADRAAGDLPMPAVNVGVSVELKRFAHFFAAREANIVKVTVHVDPQRALVLGCFGAFGATTIIYYIPGLAAGPL